MDTKEIKAKIKAEGYIRTIILFEVVGNPEEFVKRSLLSHVNKLKAEKDVYIISEAIEVPEKIDDLWSSFAEVEIIVRNLEKLTWICFQFMPSTVEIMEPDQLVFKGRDVTNWLNDLLAKNHQIGIISQQVGQENRLMLKNINALIRNSILVCLDAGIVKPSEMAKKIGVASKDLKMVFEAMIKEGKIKKTGGKYIRK